MKSGNGNGDVANPSVLRGNYAELIEGISRLARAQLRLEIARAGMCRVPFRQDR